MLSTSQTKSPLASSQKLSKNTQGNYNSNDMSAYKAEPWHTPSTLRIRASLPDHYQSVFDDEVARRIQEGYCYDEIETHHATHGPKDRELRFAVGTRRLPQSMQDTVVAD